MVAFGVVVAACERANAARARDLVIFGEPTLTPALEVLGGTRTKRVRAGVLIFKSPTPLAFALAKSAAVPFRTGRDRRRPA
jgi:hypothetical protein